MSTLKSTLTLESTDLFTTPIQLTKVVNQTLSGAVTSFQRNELPPSGTELLVDTSDVTGSLGVLYFYAEAPSTNPTAGIKLIITNKSVGDATFIKLLPGDFAYLPIYAADHDGTSIEVINTDSSNSAVINYFCAAKN